MRTLLVILSTICLLLIITNEVHAEEMVSVKLKNYIGDTSKLSLRTKGSYGTLDPSLKIKKGKEYSIKIQKGKMFISRGKSKTEVKSPFILFPNSYDDNHLIYINGRPYMGAIEFQIEEGKHIRPVNQLLLEDYLKGVVPFEVFPDWSLEALKAQTLAARTYAITHNVPGLDDTIQYQVYGGYNEFEKTKKAVSETAGEIITYKHQPISAFYSASNGGMTESNKNVWGGEPTPYFPIKEDPYDPVQPWEFSLNKTQIDIDHINWNGSKGWDKLVEKDEKIATSIASWLNRNGYEGEIKILTIPLFEIDQSKNESQRSWKGSIRIEFMRRLIDGTVLFEQFSLENVELKKIRPMIGGSYFRSYFITSFEKTPSSYLVGGKGFGHGVGMSQWGANGMAEKGKTYKEILQHYYPGTTIEAFQENKK